MKVEGITNHQALRFAENLTLPNVQVIVVSANMACSHCRERVSLVISKINAGLLDYVIDVRRREVIVTSVADLKIRKSGRDHQNRMSRKMFTCFF
ncbi:hypothetical protein MRB53_019189 [Persea americana]|uniref:Uncharacterized protein n=1 Tax=Persea americana TaxID=3435 RepID=A0ACC2KXQ6_PERAE|nr:hypothetical protein MRB53_019189 [Persea americana]